MLLDAIESIEDLPANSPIDKLLSAMLNITMELFEADRAWFMCPQSPSSPFWIIPMEKTNPEWPGLFIEEQGVVQHANISKMINSTINAKTVLSFYHDEAPLIPADVADRYHIKSKMQTATYPEKNTPWVIGIHHCSKKRKYSVSDHYIFERLAHHISEKLSKAMIAKELKNQEQHFQAYFHNPSFGLAAIKPDLTWIEANNTICHMLDYERHEITQKTWGELTHPEDLEKCAEQFYRLLAGEIQYYVSEKRLLRKDGTFIPTRCVIQGVFQSSGEIDYVTATVENLYVQHKMESTLSLYRQQAKSLLENHSLKVATLNRLNIPLAIVTAEGVIQLSNARANELIAGLNVLQIKNGLLCASNGQHSKLISAIQNAIELQRTIDIVLTDYQQEKCWISISPIEQEKASESQTSNNSSSALLVFHNPNVLDKVKTDFLRECYGLTETEARVAEAMALGLTPEEYAHSANIKITTVRTQIRSILSKVGVRRLGDVIRILTGVPSLRV